MILRSAVPAGAGQRPISESTADARYRVTRRDKRQGGRTRGARGCGLRGSEGRVSGAAPGGEEEARRTEHPAREADVCALITQPVQNI